MTHVPPGADHDAPGPERAAPARPTSRLSAYAEMAPPPRSRPPGGEPPGGRRPDSASAAPTRNAPPPVEPAGNPAVEESPEDRHRREFAGLLAGFRRTAVLVPLGEGAGPSTEPDASTGADSETRQGWLTADHNGIRFVLAFTDEAALARYAELRGRSHEEWTYETVLGEKLLDVAVPAAGMPCGVALNCADGPRGMVFPPVRGIVPDEAAIDHEHTDHYEGEIG
ncbi:hypothetical protein AB0G74_19370 [Streptomyces sp. NPDC020875]|uniref:hypothetical protein n=1 Tax=Streptomyces sp. NPDC020875 TaxID=3154898 RepID=UPI0033DB6CE8